MTTNITLMLSFFAPHSMSIVKYGLSNNFCNIGRFPGIKLESDSFWSGSGCVPVYSNPCVKPVINPCVKPVVSPCVNPCNNPCAIPCEYLKPRRDYDCKEVVLKDCVKDCQVVRTCEGKSCRSLA